MKLVEIDAPDADALRAFGRGTRTVASRNEVRTQVERPSHDGSDSRLAADRPCWTVITIGTA